jgi:hypothetical protein
MSPGDVEAVALDPGQDRIGPTINTGKGVTSVHRAVPDKHVTLARRQQRVGISRGSSVEDRRITFAGGLPKLDKRLDR